MGRDVQRRNRGISSILRRNKIVTVVLGIAIVALGVAVIANPDGATLLVTRIVGWVLVGMGAIGLVGSLFRGIKAASPVDLVIGGLQLVFGILIAVMPKTFASALFIVLGAVVLLSGIGTISDALAARSLGIGLWSWAFICGIATLALGALIIAAPFAFAEALTIVAGISLIISGLGQVAFGALLPGGSRG